MGTKQTLIIESTNYQVDTRSIIKRFQKRKRKKIVPASIVESCDLRRRRKEIWVVYENSSVCRSSCVGYLLLQGRLRPNSPRPFAPSTFPTNAALWFIQFSL